MKLDDEAIVVVKGQDNTSIAISPATDGYIRLDVDADGVAAIELDRADWSVLTHAANLAFGYDMKGWMA